MAPSQVHAETLHLALKKAKNSCARISPSSASTFEMQQHIDKLIALYEKEHLSNLTLRETVRRLRQEKSLKDRQVTLANRTIERLAVDRGSTEAQDAAKDACIRRLQTQVAVLGKKGDLGVAAEEMSCELAERVVRLEMDVQAEKSARDAFEKKARDLEEENRKLKRAVQVASEVQLAAEGVVEEREAMHKANNNKLLLAVAKAQEEAIALAKELAVTKNEKETMEAALRKAREHLQKQHEALQRWKEYESSHTKKERSLVEELETLKEAVQGMEGERQAVRRLEERVRGLVAEVETEKTRRIEAEARLKIICETELEDSRDLVCLETADEAREISEMKVRRIGELKAEIVDRDAETKTTDEMKTTKSNVIDLCATEDKTVRPTLFELANMDRSID